MASDRVLSLSMRPKLLDDCVGQEDMKTLLENQFASGRIPHFYILHGPSGSGKTTMARILAMALQKDPSKPNRLTITPEEWKSYKRFDIKEVNAADKNGVDDVREIGEAMRYQPIAPSRAKIVILDEAHRLTTAAQDILKTQTEDVSNHVYYIFCTNNLPKIDAALKRRAYLVSPKPLVKEEILQLLQKAAEHVGSMDDLEELLTALVDNGITAPGLILQAAEKFFNGMPPTESVLNSEISNLDTMGICRAVAAGNWKDVANLLKPMSKSDIVMVKNCVLGYLKAILLKAAGPRAINIAKAIRNIGDYNGDDSIPVFLANVCIGCEMMNAK